jgi:hypothetical protein
MLGSHEFANIQNPVARREVIHQKRRTTFWSRYEMLILILFAIIGSAFIFYGASRRDFVPIGIIVVWGLRAVLALRAISVASNMFSYEHDNQTWESLVLTGISARQILFGKWRAALRSTWKLAVLFAVMLYVATVSLYINDSRYVNTSSFTPLHLFFPALGVAWVPVIAFFEVLSSTALGLAASALTRRTIPAFAAAATIRFVPVLSFFLIFFSAIADYTPDWAFTFLGLGDGGTVSIMGLMFISSPTIRDRMQMLSGLVAAITMLALYLGISTIVALSTIHRSGALAQYQSVQK